MPKGCASIRLPFAEINTPDPRGISLSRGGVGGTKTVQKYAKTKQMKVFDDILPHKNKKLKIKIKIKPACGGLRERGDLNYFCV